MFILYFIFPLLLLIFVFSLKLPARESQFYAAAMGSKIVASFAMTYIQINYYDFGDLYTYFLAAKETSANLFSGDIDFKQFNGSRAIELINAIIFLVFPPSIYGLAVMSGCSSFIYCLLIVKTVDRYFEVPLAGKMLVFFLPVLSIQSGYIGKETYVLPLIGLLLFWVTSNSFIRDPKILAVLAVISIIRPYQGVFIAVALILAWTLEKNLMRRLPLAVVLLTSIAALSYEEFIQMSESLALFGGFGDFLDVVYSGGNLVLEPYPFPFSLLQSFRPFPWEAHNALAALASIEYLLVIVYVFVRATSRLRDPFVPWNLAQKRVAIFLFASIAIYLIVFSFNSNMGDLSRRHIYYYPFLLLAFSRPRPLPADGSRGHRAAPRPIGVGAT